MKAYDRRVRKNRERILRAALELFQAHGLKRTAVNDVARKAGVTPATVYNHFENKENLLRATVEYFLKSTMADFKEILEGDSPFMEKMGIILAYKSDMIEQFQGDFIRAMISEEPEMRQLVNTIYAKEIMPLVVNFYEEGKRQGYVNPDISTENIIRYMMIMRSGMAAESTFSDDPEHNQKVIQEMIPFFLYGIMSKPGKMNSE